MATSKTELRIAETGHWGKDVRSDLHVAIEPRESGGIEIALESRVAPYYGDSILHQTKDVLTVLGVQHAKVTIHDEGALPFVISARIEAAVHRAGLAEWCRALPPRRPLPQPSARDRLRRSRLYLPGSEPKYYINAALHAPDAIPLPIRVMQGVAPDLAASLTLTIDASVTLLSSRFPVDRIWRANQADEAEPAVVDLGAGGAQLEIRRCGDDDRRLRLIGLVGAPDAIHRKA